MSKITPELARVISETIVSVISRHQDEIANSIIDAMAMDATFNEALFEYSKPFLQEMEGIIYPKDNSIMLDVFIDGAYDNERFKTFDLEQELMSEAREIRDGSYDADEVIAAIADNLERIAKAVRAV